MEGLFLSSFCLEVLNNDSDIFSVNHTLIALIPKIINPRSINEFHSISLCDVIYKIKTKSLADRLKHMLNMAMFEYQRAFILSHLIMDNAVVRFESMHKLKSLYSSNLGLFGLEAQHEQDL